MPDRQTVPGRLVSRICTGLIQCNSNRQKLYNDTGRTSELQEKPPAFQTESHNSSKQRVSSFFFFRVTNVAPQNLDTKQTHRVSVYLEGCSAGPWSRFHSRRSPPLFPRYTSTHQWRQMPVLASFFCRKNKLYSKRYPPLAVKMDWATR